MNPPIKSVSTCPSLTAAGLNVWHDHSRDRDAAVTKSTPMTSSRLLIAGLISEVILLSVVEEGNGAGGIMIAQANPFRLSAHSGQT